MADRADGISVQLTNKFLDFLVENPEFLETHLFIKNVSTVLKNKKLILINILALFPQNFASVM